MRRHLMMTVVAIALAIAPRAAMAQVEVDRLLVRVKGSIITVSDVRQARGLKLVADTSSDEAAQRGLENRLLVLSEMAASNPPAPADDELALRRRAWQASLGGGDVAALLARNGMSEPALEAWLKDDVRIDAFLAKRFGAQGDVNRDKWIALLRQRAGLR